MKSRSTKKQPLANLERLKPSPNDLDMASEKWKNTVLGTRKLTHQAKHRRSPKRSVLRALEPWDGTPGCIREQIAAPGQTLLKELPGVSMTL